LMAEFTAELVPAFEFVKLAFAVAAAAMLVNVTVDPGAVAGTGMVC
jgi:hypothetical protein